MKKWTMLMMGMALALLLAGCGYFFSDNGAQADLVFVNGSDAQIASVVVYDSYGGSFLQGCQNADGSPIDRGDSFGFEVDGYPVTVVACSSLNGQGAPLATCTVEEAPAEGSGGMWPPGTAGETSGWRSAHSGRRTRDERRIYLGVPVGAAGLAGGDGSGLSHPPGQGTAKRAADRHSGSGDVCGRPLWRGLAAGGPGDDLADGSAECAVRPHLGFRPGCRGADGAVSAPGWSRTWPSGPRQRPFTASSV